MKKMYWYHYYNQVEDFIATGSFALTLAILFLQVVMRSVFNQSLTWSEELSRYIFIWQCWLGLSMAEREGQHIRIEVLKNFLPRGGKKILEYIAMLVTLATAIFLIIYGFKAMLFFVSTGAKSPANRIPMYLVYACLPISCIAYSGRIIARIVNIARGRLEVE